jgi:uncharacterized protein YegP (UPF0339 family)
MAGWFDLRRSNGQYDYVLRAANGQVLIVSERYMSKTGAQNGIASTRVNAPIGARYQHLTSKEIFMLLAVSDPHPRVTFLPCPPERSAPALFRLPTSPCDNWRSPAERRLDLGLLQREVAERLGADPCTITNWELKRTKPALRFLPRTRSVPRVRAMGGWSVPWQALACLAAGMGLIPSGMRPPGRRRSPYPQLLGADPQDSTFNIAGTYQYDCLVHGTMMPGTIVVR